jgi:chaperone BCS1
MKSSQSREGVAPGSGQSGSATVSTKENVSQGTITLSGLLNILDGFYAPTGVLFVMTTNHVEKLDKALLRPGRIDYKLYMGEASEHQKLELYRRFFPDSSESEAREFVEASPAATMAEFQGLLLALQQGETCQELVEASRRISA